MNSSIMPHSILKKSNLPLGTVSDHQPAHSREERNKQTALYHAQLLQQRKDTEALVLASIEALLDLPTPLDADPARPSQPDAAMVKKSLRPFQPADYDALIEERNINNQCGYVLCPRANKKQDTNANYRILHGRGKDPGLKFVPTPSLEKWCSNQCGKRALYVKVQLDEQPAWTRVGSFSSDIDLLEDTTSADTMFDQVGGMSDLDVKNATNRLKAVAIERGEEHPSSRSTAFGTLAVRESSSVTGKLSQPGGGSDSPSNTIEGYVPKFSAMTLGEGQEIEEDMLPTI